MAYRKFLKKEEEYIGLRVEDLENVSGGEGTDDTKEPDIREIADGLKEEDMGELLGLKDYPAKDIKGSYSQASKSKKKN